MCLFKKKKKASGEAAPDEKNGKKKPAKKRSNKIYISLSKSQTEAVVKDWYVQVKKEDDLFVHHYMWEYEDCMGEKCDWEQIMELPYNSALYFEKDRHIAYYFDDGHLAVPISSKPLKRNMVTIRL